MCVPKGLFCHLFMYMSLCEYVHMKADDHGNQRSQIPMELELSAVVASGCQTGDLWKGRNLEEGKFS